MVFGTSICISKSKEGDLIVALLVLSEDDIIMAISLLYLRNFLQNFSKSVLVL
jgi:hypothetical protein